MNEPFHFLYPEVMERFPEAKFVVLVPSNPKDWYAEYHHKVNLTWNVLGEVAGLHTNLTRKHHRNLTHRLSLREEAAHLRGVKLHHQAHRPRGLDGIPNLVDTIKNGGLARFFNCEFAEPIQTSDMVERCVEGYTQHYANVLQNIPPEKLLVFDMADGWEPLCKFLDIPVPSEPFPVIDFPDEEDYADFTSDQERSSGVWGAVAASLQRRAKHTGGSGAAIEEKEEGEAAEQAAGAAPQEKKEAAHEEAAEAEAPGGGDAALEEKKE